MNNFVKKILRLLKHKQAEINTNPINILQDCVSQLAALYVYSNGNDYRESQRDILNLRLAEIKQTMNDQFKYLQC